MQRGGISLATVGVFSWARLEPRPGEYDFAWLDEVLDLLHAGGIRVDLATATASPPPWLAHAASRDPAGDRGRRAARGRQPAAVLPELAGLPRARPASSCERVVERYARPSGARAVAREQRVRMPRQPLLLRGVGGGVPRLAAREVRLRRRAQPGVGHGVLVAALRLVRRGRAAARGADVPQPDPAARLRPVLERRAARLLPGGGRGHPRGAPTCRSRRTSWASSSRSTTGSGRRTSTSSRDDTYPDPADPVVAGVRGDGARPDALARRRSAVAADGAVAERRELACAERGEGARADAGLVVPVGGARRRRHPLLPVAAVGGRLREVPLRAWCRTAAPTRGCGGRSSSSAGSCSGSPGPEAGVEGQPRAVDVAIALDWDSWWAIEQPASPTDGLVPRDPVRVAPRAHRRSGSRSTSCAPTPTCRRTALVVAPTHFVATDAQVENLAAFAEAGGTLVVGLRHRDHRRAPARAARAATSASRCGARSACGSRSSRRRPRPTCGRVGGRNARRRCRSTARCSAAPRPGSVWAEFVRVEDAETLATFTEGALAGWPAVTRRRQRATAAPGTWPRCPTPTALRRLAERRSRRPASSCPSPVASGGQVEVVRRGELVFVINHGADDAELRSTAPTCSRASPASGLMLPPQGVAIVRT